MHLLVLMEFETQFCRFDPTTHWWWLLKVRLLTLRTWSKEWRGCNRAF